MICISANNEKKIVVNYLAIFDLDGTLYKCNSHIELLNQRYAIKVFDLLIVKAVGKVFNKMYLQTLNALYKNVPIQEVENFKPEFRKSAIELLEKKKGEGYHIVIVSNAPKELIEVAAKRLNVEWLQAEVNCKDKIVLQNYNFNKLFVCTDNISDMNLLDIADEKTIYVTNKTKRLFSEKYIQAQILEV